MEAQNIILTFLVAWLLFVNFMLMKQIYNDVDNIKNAYLVGMRDKIDRIEVVTSDMRETIDKTQGG
ncbi:hypothetical protein DRO91_06065 [Candidatus Heimdallarchaeota archaeon]|nr:MAG: hypothetical protein DRO91_06065 [Candidatus Heimdallarchaeota archaeon]